MSEDNVSVIFGARIEGLVAGVEEAKAQIESLGSTVSSVTSIFTEMGEAVIAAFAVEQIEQFVESVSDLGSKIESASAQLGKSTQDILGLKYAAAISDMSFDQATKTIDRFYMSVQQAQTVTSRQAAAFAALGMNVNDLTARGVTMEQMLDMATAKLGQFGDGANKSTIIMDLFGNRSAQTVRFVNVLSEGIQNLSTVAQSLDPPIKENLETLQEMHVRISDMGQVWDNWKMKMADVLLLLVKIGEGFMEFVSIVGTGFKMLMATTDAVVDSLKHGYSTEGMTAYEKKLDDIIAKEKQFINEMENPSMKGAGTNTSGPPAPGVQTGQGSQMQQWEAELKEQELKNKIFYDDALELEANYWNNKLLYVQKGTAEYDAVISKVYELDKRREQERLTGFRATIDEEQSLAGDDIKKKIALQDELLAYLKQNYAHDYQAYAEALRKKNQLANEEVKQEEAKWHDLFSKMTSGFNQAINGMIRGTTTLKQAIGDIFLGILNGVLDTLEKMAEKWVENEIFSSTASKTQAVAAITDNAATAASGAYASTAAIPVVGPSMAPAAAATAHAGAMSWIGSLVGLDVGAWEISQDMPAMLHKGESVVPTTFAEGLRQNGGFGGGAIVNINAVDAKSIKDLFMQNGPTIMQAIKQQSGRFNSNAPGWRT